MSGKFLQIWPLRNVTRTIAVLVMIAIAVAIYATRKMPDNFEDDEEWEFWRNFDFGVCVISLAFASTLLYGSIVEFRLFVLLWIIWDVLFAAFWITFLARKYDEFAEWERKFRLAVIILMLLAEIPVFSYFRYLRVKDKDPESNFSWIDAQSDKVYKNLHERHSLTSIDKTFGTTSGITNAGFGSGRNSVISVASEENEERTENDGKKITEMEKENEKVEESKEENELKQEDGSSQSSFETSVTVHTKKTASTELDESRENCDGAVTRLSSSSTNEAGRPRTSSSYIRTEEDDTKQRGEVHFHISIDNTEERRANLIASKETDTGVVMEGVGRTLPSNSSVTVEIDVTDTMREGVYQTSF